jgi:glycosyltransferase involved in cell wall biosynthesis
MVKDLVSVIVPCYNSEKWLGEALKSSLSQTWQNIEVIIVDDGSTDNSLSIAKSFASNKVKVISQDNRGASSARNRALKEAQGDFIQYLDADDLLAPNKIESQIKIIQENNHHFIIAGAWARFYAHPTDAKFIQELVWQDMAPVDWLICSWKGGGMMHPAAWLTSRDIIQKAGDWHEDLSLNDDGEYFCRVILASQGVKFCSEAKSYYRSALPNSLSRKNDKSAIESAFKAANLCINHILSVEDTKLTQQASATLLQRLVYSVYPNHLDLVQDAETRIRSLGGSNLQIQGGNLFKMFTKLLGWKLARRIQKLSLV